MPLIYHTVQCWQLTVGPESFKSGKIYSPISLESFFKMFTEFAEALKLGGGEY